jgi:hypothetical protein
MLTIRTGGRGEGEVELEASADGFRLMNVATRKPLLEKVFATRGQALAGLGAVLDLGDLLNQPAFDAPPAVTASKLIDERKARGRNIGRWRLSPRGAVACRLYQELSHFGAKDAARAAAQARDFFAREADRLAKHHPAFWAGVQRLLATMADA